ncbi:MAG: polysaccharide deacetylase family protein [Victivallaceae bacterium]|nr:polysaccharide deacetylase family protein [Victivallaceae bacterium]
MALSLFMYHRILPEPGPENIALDMFRRQLDYLQSHYRMLAASEVEKFISGEIRTGEPCAALSFDDGWCDNLFFAHDELQSRGLSALLAVSAGCLWDGEIRKDAAPELLRRPIAESQRASREGDKRAYCNRAELAEMERSGVWRLEVHGTKHELGDGNASILSYPQNGMDCAAFRKFLADDLQNCRDELTKLTGRKHHLLFWPWGHYSSVAAETAKSCDFDIQFTVAKGAISCGSGHGVFPRIGVSPKWTKFRRNAFIFRHPVLAYLHGFSHKLKVCFDDRMESNEGRRSCGA